MLRKVSAIEPVLGVVGTVCVEGQNIGLEDPPPEALEVDTDLPLPRPPVLFIPENDAPVFGAEFESPPVCPVPQLQSVFNPLTGQTEQYYFFPPGTEIPDGCGIGSGIF